LCYVATVTDLSEKIVLVTGAGGGLGRSLARGFAGQGCRIAITSRTAEKLQAAAEEIAQLAVPVLSMVCDIREKHQVESLAQEVRTRLGSVQILVNNAGVAEAMSFLEMPDNLWDETLQTNLTGAYYCCKTFLPGMIESGWGRIVNIASTTAKVGYSHTTAYTSSKHGLLGLTRSLALETARLKITVNAICPGYINDERTRDNARKMAQKTGRSVEEILALFAASAPQNRLIEPDEVVSLALLLASEEAGGITGQAINVDGGAVMI
jgi:NAD(P)-dependent dehydrogenase (short-subunit alcohol dehydrogenase family)